MKHLTFAALLFLISCNKSEYENLSQYCDDSVYSEAPTLHNVKYKLESGEAISATASGYGTGISTIGSTSTIFIEMSWGDGNIIIEIAQPLGVASDTFSVNDAYNALAIGKKIFQVASTSPPNGVNLIFYSGSRHESKYRNNADSHFTITERGVIYHENGISFADIEGSFCCYVYDLQSQSTTRLVGNFSGKSKLSR